MGKKKGSEIKNESRRKKGEGGLHYREDRKQWVYSEELGFKPDGSRIRIERSGKTQAEAKENFMKATEAFDLDYMLSQPTVEDISRQMPFMDFMIIFIGKYKKRKDGRALTSKTKNFYFYLASKMKEIGTIPLDKLNTEVLQKCIERVQFSKVQTPGNNSDEISERVMAALITLLRAAFRFGVAKGVIHSNYMADVTRPVTIRGRRMALTGRALSLPTHVVEKLMDALMQDPMCKAMITTLLYTGLRIGEVRALTHSSWNRINCSFMVDKNAVCMYEFENGKVVKEWTDISSTKNTSSVREIIYDESLNEVLDEWIQYREKYKAIREHVAEQGANALLFPGVRSGKVMDYRTINKKFHRILDEVDLGVETHIRDYADRQQD